MKTKILLGLILSIMISTTAFAYTNTNKLSAESSWEDILSNPNVEVKGTWIRVGNINTSVFFVEEEGGILYTKKPTRDGYWKEVNSGSDNDRREFIQTGESIKSGSVVTPIAQFETIRINRDRDKQIKVGYKDYDQPLTRKLKVYEIKEVGRDDNRQERFLFEKEFTVPTRIE